MNELVVDDKTKMKVNESRVIFTNFKNFKEETIDVSRLIRVFVNNIESHKKVLSENNNYVNIKKKLLKMFIINYVIKSNRFTTFLNFQKGEPMYDLIMEIKRDIKKQMRQLDKVNVWKELLDFWYYQLW